MAIQELIKLVPPPQMRIEAGSLREWHEVEQKLGLELPSDYRDFILSYGTGLFAGFYRVYNPFASSEWMNLQSSIERVCKAEREIKDKWLDHIPYPIYPEKEGILPWGNDENGNEYFWLMDGPPDEWRVLSDEVRGEGFRYYGCSMTDFLTRILRRQIEALAGDYPREEHYVFTPFQN